MTTTAERPLSERELCELEMAVTGDRDCADLAGLLTRLIHQVRNPGPLNKAISERDKAIAERDEAVKDRREMFDQNEESLDDLSLAQEKLTCLQRMVDACRC